MGYAAARMEPQRDDEHASARAHRPRRERGYEIEDSLDDRRDSRHFDLEAQRRQRRYFIALMSGFAILAVLAGALLAIWIFEPLDEPEIAAVAQKEETRYDPPTDNGDWEDDDVEPEPPETGTKPPPLKATLDNRDINRGLANLRSALDACARKHGAIEQMVVKVDFTVAPSGRVSSSAARPPFSVTPLGRCVADVISSQGKFRRTRDGLADIHRTVTLRRPDL